MNKDSRPLIYRQTVTQFSLWNAQKGRAADAARPGAISRRNVLFYFTVGSRIFKVPVLPKGPLAAKPI